MVTDRYNFPHFRRLYASTGGSTFVPFLIAYKNMNQKIGLCALLSAFFVAGVHAREKVATRGYEAEQAKADTSETAKSPRLQIGGYGEAVMQRMFYSDDVARYSSPERYKNGTHGRFDLPHVVFYLGYDFGRGWKLGTEVEFEHGGAGVAIEIENEESGEYEREIEKGGEVALEQFWIEKTWSERAALRMGHVIVPVGLTNLYHTPTDFFSVLRPEEETSILPCTWHETGVTFRGRIEKWRYEALFTVGLDAERFNNANWIKGGSTSPYEFSIANRYAGVIRIDNFSVKGLRVGLSGYYGHSGHNSLKSTRYKNRNITGAVTTGTLDAVYDNRNVLFRGNLIYGHLSDSYLISAVNTSLPSASPSPRTATGSDVLSWYAELGYDLIPFFFGKKNSAEKLYVYGHYGYCNAMYKTAGDIQAKAWCEKNILAVGVNYFPLRSIVVKAEYRLRRFSAPYNNEPVFSLGIGYASLFER